jgi:signal transduction histidine kinase
MLKAQKGSKDSQECLISRSDGSALELKVWTEPFVCKGNNFTLLAIADISNEKRRRFLERLFFHDILNDAGCLRGYTELLRISDPGEAKEYAEVIYDVSDALIEDIISQQELIAAENNELKTYPAIIETMPILKEIAINYSRHQTAAGKYLETSEDSENNQIIADKKTFRRVIGNLIKNALEAMREGQKLTISSRAENDSVIVQVANPGVIPREIQLQIFQRSFSTKGAGRGLGTYSIKLLTERYLHGEVYFSSNQEEGTIFCVKLPKEAVK